jgi:GNAT superfamily N-acetyltransferase
LETRSVSLWIRSFDRIVKNIRLREVEPDDVDFLYNLHREALMPYIDLTWGWEEEWQAGYFKEHFNPADRKIIQWFGEDIGCISVQDQVDALFIAYIAILPIYQWKGVGTYLIGNVIQEAEHRKIPVRLQTLKANPVWEWYEHLGFRRTGSTKTHILMER